MEYIHLIYSNNIAWPLITLNHIFKRIEMTSTIKTMSNTRLFREWLTQCAKLRNHNKGYLTILTECTKLIKTAIEREMDARQMNWRILNSQKTILITFSEN